MRGTMGRAQAERANAGGDAAESGALAPGSLDSGLDALPPCVDGESNLHDPEGNRL